MNIKNLGMWECEELEESPLGLVTSLRWRKYISIKCRSLEEILEGVGALTSLKKLVMQACEALEKFPLGLRKLSTLEELDFSIYMLVFEEHTGRIWWLNES